MIWECDWCGKQFKKMPIKPCAKCEKEQKYLGTVFNLYCDYVKYRFKNGSLVFDGAFDD